MSNVLDLPHRGLLLVATDLQGHLADFRRVAALFEGHRRRRPDTYLVLTGDLIHGPELGPDEWPDHLGSFYVGESVALLEEAALLQQRHEGHVHYLLGNHEHAHIGGPVVGKFFPDEAARLEELLGPERTRWARDWFSRWPLLAIAPAAGLCLLHGAPHAPLLDRKDVESIDVTTAFQGGSFCEVHQRNVLTSILWARAASSERARAFLRALGPDLRVAIHGHDVAREGFVVEDATHLCLSSSFGCHDGDKIFLSWELNDPALSALDVARRGLHRLWPDAPPVHLDPCFREGLWTTVTSPKKKSASLKGSKRTWRRSPRPAPRPGIRSKTMSSN